MVISSGWSTVLFITLSLIYTPVYASSPSFENTAVVRTVELDGALTHITTRYTVRALENGASEYTFALGEQDGKLTTWTEASVKGAEELALKSKGLDSKSRTWLYTATLPKGLQRDTDITLELITVQSNAGTPLPATVAQGEPESLKYDTDLFVQSPYKTRVQRTKIRLPTPKTHNYTRPSLDPHFTKEDLSVSKSGSTITYGPYSDIPVSTTSEFVDTTQQRISIHYELESPVLRVLSLRRTAEVSHWGSNLNIEDEIRLKNDGPRLKGHFSRVSHQLMLHRQLPLFGTLTSITMHLPAGIAPPYYYDVIGNVSTSKFRPSSILSTKLSAAQWSVLELKPRYPLLGGWNYSFTLGWDAPLGDSAMYDAAQDRYILGVPFWTTVPTASVDTAEVKIVLPEGATDVEVFEPFQVDSITRTTHFTYLDTTGRPAVLLKKDRINNHHAKTIYVTYRVPVSAHLKKPTSIGAAIFGTFVLALFARRVDPRLHKNSKKVN